MCINKNKSVFQEDEEKKEKKGGKEEEDGEEEEEGGEEGVKGGGCSYGLTHYALVPAIYNHANNYNPTE